MTILFFSRLFYPHIGGVEKHMLEVAKRLTNKSYRVIVVTEKDKASLKKISLKKKDKIARIEVYRIPVGESEFFKKFRIWWWLWRNRQLIEKADIIHAHDVFFWYLPFRFLYRGKPVFTTFHGYETKFPLSKRAIFIRKISEKLSWGNICVGEYIKKWYGTRPAYTTYGGVEILPINTNTTNKYQSRNKKRIKILFIGRLEEDTGIKIYLNALEILKRKNIDFEFEACGDGTLREVVEKWGRVHGFVTNIIPNLTRSDLVFSSSYLSILEALANKKPVFSVYSNSLKEDYLKNTPFAKFIVIEGSAKNLVEKIKSKQKNISEAYEWVKEQTWDKVSDIYESLYSRYSFK